MIDHAILEINGQNIIGLKVSPFILIFYAVGKHAFKIRKDYLLIRLVALPRTGKDCVTILDTQAFLPNQDSNPTTS